MLNSSSLKNISDNSVSRPLLYLSIILISAFIVRCYHITFQLNGNGLFRQTQTAGLIMEYFRNGINMFYPKMITLGEPGILVLEFPLYQAIAALLYKIFFPNVVFAKLLTVIIGVLSIYYIYRISMKFLGQRSSLLAAFFYAFAPLNSYYQSVPMPDALTVFLSLLMLDSLIEGIINERKPFLIPAVLAATVGLMMKSPYVAPLYLPFIYLYFKKRGLKSFLTPSLLIVFIVPFTFMVLWQAHVNSVNEIYFNNADYPFREMRPSVIVKMKPLNAWYFGTLDQRLDIHSYFNIAQRIKKTIFSVVGIIFFIPGIIYFFRNKTLNFFKVWLLAILASIMVIFNLNVVHTYYQLPILPLTSVICGIGASHLIERSKNKKALLIITVLLLAAFSVNSFRYHIRYASGDKDYQKIGRFIDTSIEKNQMVAISHPTIDLYDPSIMYFTNRHGFTLSHNRLNKDMIEYLIKKGVKYMSVVDYGDNESINLDLFSEYKIVSSNNNVIIYNLFSK